MKSKIRYFIISSAFVIFSLVFAFNSFAATPKAATMTAFEVTKQATTSVSLSWESTGKNITGYKLYVYDPVAKKSTLLNTFDYKTTKTTVKNLLSGTDYTFKIKSYYTNNGSTVNSSTLTTSTYTTIPKGSGLTLESVTDKSAVLTWKAIPGIDSYRIYYYNKTTEKYVLMGTKSTNRCSITCTPATEYNFKVKPEATVSSGIKIYGTASDALIVYTKPSKMTLSKSSVSTTSVKLTWTEQAKVDGYRIYKYDDAEGAYVLIKTVSKGTSNYTVSGLSAGKEYRFKAKAYYKPKTDNINGEYSSVLKVVTKPTTPTLTQSPDRLNNGQVQLSWTKCSGAKGYYIYISEHKNSDFSMVKTISSGSTLKATLTNVPSGVKYVKICAYTDIGGSKTLSGYSKVIEVRA